MHKTFNFETVEDFDRHIALSIPNYDGLLTIVKAVFLEFMEPNGTCTDIGCSTGRVLTELQRLVPAKYTGVDVIEMLRFPPSLLEKKYFEFHLSDCVEYLSNLESQDVVISMFTLQFLPNKKRKEAFNNLRRLVSNGTTLILAEKVFSNNVRVNSVLNREHIRQKRGNFTDTEILDKDYELAGSMFCKTSKEINHELASIGNAEQIWQSYNFRAWVVSR